jgi:hypothetical protein
MQYLMAIAIVLGACSSNQTCSDDNCVCSAGAACEHDCDQGTSCMVVCAAGETCGVTCEIGQTCMVDASQSGMTSVDCTGATSCQVTCPATGCEVLQCVTLCAVTCGGSTAATMNGTTATCP